MLDGNHNCLPAKGKAVTVSNESVPNNHGRDGKATLIKEMRRTNGKKEQRLKLAIASQAKK